jgi:hypothetical protein
MATTYTYKRQGNGVDSWTVTETDSNGEVTSIYMVYEDPNKKATIREFEKLSTEDIASFKSIIGVTGGSGGGSVTLLAGDGIDVADNFDGSYTISSAVREFPGIRAGNGINVDRDPESGVLKIDNEMALKGGYTGQLQVWNGKYLDFYYFENGLLLSVEAVGGEQPIEE